MLPSLSQTSKVLGYQILHSIETRMQTTTQKVDFFSKRTFTFLKNNPSSHMLSYNEFVKQRIGSKEEYESRIKLSFPDASSREIDDWFDTRCASGYRDYKEDWLRPNYNPGLILTPGFFREESGDETNKS